MHSIFMEDEIQFLKYDHENESFQWHGTSQELQSFVNLTLNLTDEEHGELCQDRAHNAVTYKIKDMVYIRLYNSTRKLVINGPENRSFKTKLLDLLKAKKGTEFRNAQHNAEPSKHGKQVDNAEDEGRTAPVYQADHDMEDEPDNQTDSSLKAEIQRLRKDFEKLEDFVYNGGQMHNNMPMVAGNLNPDQTDELALREEVAALKQQLLVEQERNRSAENQMRSTIKSLGEERDSLLTAIRLMNSDRQQEAPYGTPHSPEDDQSKGSWTIVQSKNKTKKTERKEPSVDAQAINSQAEKPASQRTSKPPDKPTAVILGDSITKNIEGRKMSRSIRIINKSFPGSTVEDMSSYTKPSVEKKPDYVILHTGTNNIKKDQTRILADKIIDLATNITSKLPDSKVMISGITRRNDPGINTKINEVNKIVKLHCSQRDLLFIDNSNIDDSHLNASGLHLNRKGIIALAKNFTSRLDNH